MVKPINVPFIVVNTAVRLMSQRGLSRPNRRSRISLGVPKKRFLLIRRFLILISCRVRGPDFNRLLGNDKLIRSHAAQIFINRCNIPPWWNIWYHYSVEFKIYCKVMLLSKTESKNLTPSFVKKCDPDLRMSGPHLRMRTPF